MENEVVAWKGMPATIIDIDNQKVNELYTNYNPKESAAYFKSVLADFIKGMKTAELYFRLGGNMPDWPDFRKNVIYRDSSLFYYKSFKSGSKKEPVEILHQVAGWYIHRSGIEVPVKYAEKIVVVQLFSEEGALYNPKFLDEENILFEQATNEIILKFLLKDKINFKNIKNEIKWIADAKQPINIGGEIKVRLGYKNNRRLCYEFLGYEMHPILFVPYKLNRPSEEIVKEFTLLNKYIKKTTQKISHMKDLIGLVLDHSSERFFYEIEFGEKNKYVQLLDKNIRDLEGYTNKILIDLQKEMPKSVKNLAEFL